MTGDFVPILLIFVFAVFLAVSIIIISSFLGRNKKRDTLLTPYECGIDQATLPTNPVSVKFFVIALLFLLFDVEVALLYPWAALFRKFVEDGMGHFIMIEGLAFIGILAVGLIYVFRNGVFNWGE